MDWLLARPLLPYLLYSAQPDPARQNPLIDEPATGVGNDDLWHGDCSPGSQDPTCTAGATAQTGE
jgi:hypothetical protein